MIELRCPAVWTENITNPPKSIFLAGGISNAHNWQPEMVELLKLTNSVLINPRRDNFDVNNPKMTEEQIEWEFNHLKISNIRLFWFPCETLCPITLFELGKYIEKPDPLFIGCHPDYKRKIDLEVQLRLARPHDAKIYYSLEELAAAVKETL